MELNKKKKKKKTKTKIFKMMKSINSLKRTNHKIINPKTLNIPPLKISYGGVGEEVGKISLTEKVGIMSFWISNVL
jgi:hypothetical protein